MKAFLTKAGTMEMGRKWQTEQHFPDALRETRQDAKNVLVSTFSLSFLQTLPCHVPSSM